MMKTRALGYAVWDTITLYAHSTKKSGSWRVSAWNFDANGSGALCSQAT